MKLYSWVIDNRLHFESSDSIGETKIVVKTLDSEHVIYGTTIDIAKNTNYWFQPNNDISKFEEILVEAYNKDGLTIFNKIIPTKYKPEKIIPLMKSEEIVDLVSYLNRDQEMLEIGGGRSTVFFSQIVKKLVTVEHNREWANKISEFKELKNKDWTLYVVEPNWPQSHPFQPAEYGQFDNYIKFIETLNDNRFDVILIDGRDRVRSAKASIPKLKTGGILLVHDFWNRPKYHSIIHNTELVLVEDDNSYNRNPNNTLVAFKKI